MFIEQEYKKFIDRKEMKKVKHLITDKQKNQIKDVLLRIKETGITKDSLARRIIPNMIRSEVDNLFVRRLARKKKYTPKGTTKYGMLLLYGRKGYDYWEEYKRKQQYTNTFEYKNEKYGWTKEEFDNFNKSRAVTLENLKEKHGKVEGKRLWENYREKQRYTNSLDYYIEQYGYVRGKQEWEKLNQRKGITFENLMRKYGDEEKVEEVFTQWMRNKNYSLISQRLFIKLYDNIPNKLKNKCYFATLNREFGKFDKKRNRGYMYDFVISNIQFCIEFNGDIYHANPKFYKPFDIPPFKGNKSCALEIWDNDKIKFDFLRNLGYDVIIIWENDFINNENYIIDKCLRRIYERC